MNLSILANGLTSLVHPSVAASVQKSTGKTVGSDGTLTPTYGSAETVQVNRQPLTSNDLRIIDGLNLTGQKAGLYVWGDYSAGQSQDGTGGDLFALPDGTVWLAVAELENWWLEDGWKRLAVVRQ